MHPPCSNLRKHQSILQLVITMKLMIFILFLSPASFRCQTINNESDVIAQSNVITVGVFISGSSDDTPGYQYLFDKALDKARSSVSPVYNFTKVYPDIQLHMVMLPEDHSILDVLNALCDEFLPRNVTAMVHLRNPLADLDNPEESTNFEESNNQLLTSEYFLQLANYLGIPVILTWDAAAELGLKKKMFDSVILQMVPTIQHQAAAMISILIRYHWKIFSVVYTNAPGHKEFMESIERGSKQSSETLELEFVLKLDNLSDSEETRWMLQDLAWAESRVILLHCNATEAVSIMKIGRELELTKRTYMWIVTKSVLGYEEATSPELPVGMLGVTYGSNKFALFENAIATIVHGLEEFVNEPQSVNHSLASPNSCHTPTENRWKDGIYLHNPGHIAQGFQREITRLQLIGRVGFMVSHLALGMDPSEEIRFNMDGTRKNPNLDFVNLGADHKWTKVGSWHKGSMHVKDIIWPGHSPHPPKGIVESYFLTVGFLEEPPFVYMVLPDNKTGLCHAEAEKCRIPPVPPGYIDPTGVGTNETQYRCCFGFCVDLLKNLAKDMSFSFEMQRAQDGLWGGIQKNGTWNGIISELINREIDMAMTSLKINSLREAAVDFSVPFLETGISVVVAKRTGIISPKAFLEPFDMMTWFFVLVLSIQLAALSIFIFEYLTPTGNGRKMTQSSGEGLSLFQTYWLVWAFLLGASVNVVGPRGYTSLFMSTVWAAFAKVFLAIYTANLASFMITQEEFYNLNGLSDPKLQFPHAHDPKLRFGTIPHGNTDHVIKDNFPDMHRYMKIHNYPTVKEGIAAVKKGNLDAFVYDSTVLEYLSGQDDNCSLLTVGSWYAKTGYGIAVPPKSALLKYINKELLKYSTSGVFQKLSEFWLGGACNEDDDSKRDVSGHAAIGLKQSTSAFLLLGCGLFLGIVLVGLEALYFSHFRSPLAKHHRGGNCCMLLSQNLGNSLEFGYVKSEEQSFFKHHKCKDPICDTLLWKVRHELDMSKLKNRLQDQEIKMLRSTIQGAKI